MKVVQTFSAPMHLVMRMDEQIAGHRRKSAWICSAIDSKLRGEGKCNILEHEDIELLQAARYVATKNGKKALATYITELIHELQSAA